jgi:hypothetical protein
MIQRPIRPPSENPACPDRGADTERAEMAAFFRELGLGWEVDAERLIDRLADARSER